MYSDPTVVCYSDVLCGIFLNRISGRLINREQDGDIYTTVQKFEVKKWIIIIFFINQQGCIKNTVKHLKCYFK